MSAAAVTERRRPLPDPKACQRLAEQMLSLSMAAGADGAEVLVRDGTEMEVKIRLGEPELIKEAGSRALGLRVLKDHRAAVTYTSDFAPGAMERFARETVELAALAEPDPTGDLPAREEMAREVPDLDLWDDAVLGLDVAEAIRRARAAEAAAMKSDARVTNSEGAVFGSSVGAAAFATSAGFSGSNRGTHASLYVQPIADDEGGKKRNGSYWTSSRFVGGVARRRPGRPRGGAPHAGQARLAQDRDLRGAGGLLARGGARPAGAVRRRHVGRRGLAQEHLPGAARRDAGRVRAVRDRRRSAAAARAGVAPLRRRGPAEPHQRAGVGRRAADVPVRRLRGAQARAAVDRLGGARDRRRSPRLDLEPDPARRAVRRPRDLEKLERGLYVTDLMGFGFNGVTGDYSQGAAGFWIERGERAFPVSEITISANFDDLWKGIDALGDDLDTRSSIQCPTFRVGKMTVAGR